MAAPALNPAPHTIQKLVEDPLEYLPCSTILDYRKGQPIYNPDQPDTNLFLVIAGRVKVSRVTDDGRQVWEDV